MSNDIHLLSGAYAVDALDDLERARFEAHLDICHDCRMEVAGLREAATSLTDTTTAAPPAELRERVLAGITTVRPLPPLAPTGPRAPGRASHRRWFPVLAVAAALALIAGLGVWQPWQTSPVPERVLTAAEQVIGAPDAERVSLKVAGADATVYRSKTRGQAVLVATGMPPAPDDKVYELWLRDETGHLEPAGLMPAGTDHTVVLRGNAADSTGVGITVEPAGGAPRGVPTDSPIAVFDFAEATT